MQSSSLYDTGPRGDYYAAPGNYLANMPYTATTGPAGSMPRSQLPLVMTSGEITNASVVNGVILPMVGWTCTTRIKAETPSGASTGSAGTDEAQLEPTTLYLEIGHND